MRDYFLGIVTVVLSVVAYLTYRMNNNIETIWQTIQQLTQSQEKESAVGFIHETEEEEYDDE